MTRQGWMEMFLLFFLVTGINVLWTPDHLGYPTSVLHPYLLPILLTAARYGIGAGLFASFVGCLLMIGLSGVSYDFPFQLRSSGMQLTPANLLDEPRNLVVASWILLSAVLGAVLERVRKERDHYAQELEQLQDIHQETKTRNEILSSENQDLREKVLGKGDTVATVYEMARRLTTLRGQDLYYACLELVEKFVGSERSSIYLLADERRKFELAESMSQEQNPAPFLKELGRGDPLLEKCVDENRTVSVRELFTAQRTQQKLSAVLCAPLATEEEGVLGVLVIEALPFESLNSQTVSVLELLADWTSRSLAVVQRFERGDDTIGNSSNLSSQLGRRRLSRTAINTLSHYEPTLRMALRVLADSKSHQIAKWNAANLLFSAGCSALEIEEPKFQEILNSLMKEANNLVSMRKSLPARRRLPGCQGLRSRLQKSEKLLYEAFRLIFHLHVQHHYPQHEYILEKMFREREQSLKLLHLERLTQEVEFLAGRKREAYCCFGLNRPLRQRSEPLHILQQLTESRDGWTSRLAYLAMAELELSQDCSSVNGLLESGQLLDAEAAYLAMGKIDPGVLSVWPEPDSPEEREVLDRVRQELHISFENLEAS